MAIRGSIQRGGGTARRAEEVPGRVVQAHLAAGKLTLTVDLKADNLTLLGNTVGMQARTGMIRVRQGGCCGKADAPCHPGQE
jgi:hypothetical protein